MNGNLIIRPLSAKLTHDTEHFGKMDPYVKVILGNEYKETSVAKNQHLNPTWDSELSFRLNNNDVIYFEVYNKETLTKDDLIGSGSLFVSSFIKKGQFSEWLPLVFKDKPAGELLLEIQFFPDGGQLGANQGTSSKVGNYSQGTYTQPTHLGTVGQEQGVGQAFTQPNTGFQTFGQQSTGSTQGTNLPNTQYYQGFKDGFKEGFNQGLNQGMNQGYNL